MPVALGFVAATVATAVWFSAVFTDRFAFENIGAATGVKDVSLTFTVAVRPAAVTVRVSTPSVVASADRGTEIRATPSDPTVAVPVIAPPTMSEELTVPLIE